MSECKKQGSRSANSPANDTLKKEDGGPLNPDVLRRDVLYPILDRLGIARSRRAGLPHVPPLCCNHREPEDRELETRSETARALQLEHDDGSVHAYLRRGRSKRRALALEQVILGNLFQVVEHGTRK